MKVEKRNGNIVEFEKDKIIKAVKKAFNAVKTNISEDDINNLMDFINENLPEDVKRVEDIQDTIVLWLHKNEYHNEGIAFTKYRERRAIARDTSFNSVNLVNEYLCQLDDMAVHENSSTMYSLQGLNNHLFSSVSEKYWLSLYSDEIKNAYNSGRIHIHDLQSISAYTYFGKECVIVKNNNKIELLSLESLYEKIETVNTIYIDKDDATIKTVNNLMVLDKDGWTNVSKLTKKRKNRPMMFLKNKNGRSVIVTDNHPMITQNGEIEAKYITETHKTHVPNLKKIFDITGDKILYKKYIYVSKYFKENNIFELGKDKIYVDGIVFDKDCNINDEDIIHIHSANSGILNKIELDSDLGYFIGFYLAEGCTSYNGYKMAYKASIVNKDHEILKKIHRILTKNGVFSTINIKGKKENDMYNLDIFNRIFITTINTVFNMFGTSQTKRLPLNILEYNIDFIKGILSGMIDGDGSIKTGTVNIRIASRELLNQIAMLSDFLGINAIDLKPFGAGSTRIYKNREIVQQKCLYGLTFRKKDSFSLPMCQKYNSLIKTKKRCDLFPYEEKDSWHNISTIMEIPIIDEYIYDITTDTNTLIVNGMYNHNCSGWDLKSLLLEGFGGVAGKPSSKPPKHLSSALNQANNFIFTVQGEFAGAIAFSNFNTLLAPFVREDDLSYNQVKQEIQQFIYNLNISTRVGFQCLSEDTEILSKNGWVGYNDLKVGDKIITFNMSSKQFEYKETQNVFKKQYEGKMVHISDGLFGYVDHLVTPNHRVVVYDDKKDEYVFENAENIKQCENDINIPLPIPAISNPTCDDMTGVGFVNIRKDDIKYVDYSSIVWCPTTENGTVIARRNGKCFITGNSPFSNLTLDLDTTKVKFADEPCIVGGEMKEYSYGDCNKEATWINQAVVEVLSEGDADGAMLSYPIVTFNVTKDFPWQNKLGKTVLDTTSKYGSFYFCLDENHIVYTETGRKMLKDVTVTDKILDNNNNYIGISNIIRNKKDEYLKITTKDNKTIKSSLNHRFPVLNTENNLKYVIKKAEELSISDKLMRNMYEIQLENGLIIDSDNIHLFEVCDNNGNEIQLKEFENVTDFVSIKRKRDLIKIKDISDFLFIPERHKTAIKMLTKIPSNINSDIYELLGELLGDGYVKQKDGHITLTNADTEILDFFSEKIKELFDYNVTIGKAGNSLKAKTVHLHSVHIKEFLKYCGLEMANYKHKNIPSQMFTETDNHIGALLRGIFDTDGSIGLSNGGSAIIKLVMKNEKIIKDIQVLLALLNINSSRKHRESDYCPTLYITGYNNILNFYKKVGFRIIRKQEILKKYCKTAIETKQLNRPYVGCKIISKDEIKNPEYEKYFYKKYEENDRKYFRILETDDEKLYYFVDSVVVKNNVSLDIIKIEHVYENINLIDITVNNKEHLFMIDGGVITHNSNYINSDYSESDITSMCCRLKIDRREIQKHLGEYTGGLSETEYDKTHQKGHGFFGASPNTGSVGVTTLNIPAIMHDAKEKGGDWDEFLTLVKYYMDLAIDVLMKKRKVVEEYMEKGLYPYARHYLREVKKRTGHYFTQHFSTICPNGVHEALYIYGFKDGIMCEDGLNKAIELLKFMNEYTVVLQKEHKVLVNLEQAPAESAGVKLCKKSGIDPFGNGYYTNSTWQPAEAKIDLVDLIEMQGKLNVYYSGGSSMHTYTDSDLVPVAQDLHKIIMFAFTETKIPYMTISPVFTVCPKCGRIAGKHDICPKCGSKKTEIYERIVGYYRPHTNWNKGRLKESEKRNYLKFDKK